MGVSVSALPNSTVCKSANSISQSINNLELIDALVAHVEHGGQGQADERDGLRLDARLGRDLHNL